MSDALDRLKQRQRPKVAPRDASLTSGHQGLQTPEHQDIGMSRHKDIPMSEPQDVEVSRRIDPKSTKAGPAISGVLSIPGSGHLDAQASEKQDELVDAPRHTDIYMSRHMDGDLPMKRSTFRLETDLIDRLHAFCRRQGLSREVLIEAMYEYMEAHPEALAQVVEQAGQKHDHRQQLANRKRAEAMISKFGRDA